MSYHFKFVRMTLIRKTKDESWQDLGKIGIPTHCEWEGEIVQLLWKRIWRFVFVLWEVAKIILRD